MRVSTESGSFRVMTTRGFLLTNIPLPFSDDIETSLTKSLQTAIALELRYLSIKAARQRQRKIGIV
ncbi:hypothetical protein NY486_28955, partial [Enterobacter hormaechei]|nr:hypothetical protein [Enterobacter hormaechei]